MSGISRELQNYSLPSHRGRGRAEEQQYHLHASRGRTARTGEERRSGSGHRRSARQPDPPAYVSSVRKFNLFSFIRCTISHRNQSSCSTVCPLSGLRFRAPAQGYAAHQQGSHPAALARPAPSPPAHRRFWNCYWGWGPLWLTRTQRTLSRQQSPLFPQLPAPSTPPPQPPSILPAHHHSNSISLCHCRRPPGSHARPEPPRLLPGLHCNRQLQPTITTDGGARAYLPGSTCAAGHWNGGQRHEGGSHGASRFGVWGSWQEQWQTGKLRWASP